MPTLRYVIVDFFTDRERHDNGASHNFEALDSYEAVAALRADFTARVDLGVIGESPLGQRVAG